MPDFRVIWRLARQRTADMPKLYTENGIVKALIIAVLPKDSEDSFALVIPVEK